MSLSIKYCKKHNTNSQMQYDTFSILTTNNNNNNNNNNNYNNNKFPCLIFKLSHAQNVYTYSMNE